jgi:hypothetical protein
MWSLLSRRVLLVYGSDGSAQSATPYSTVRHRTETVNRGLPNGFMTPRLRVCIQCLGFGTPEAYRIIPGSDLRLKQLRAWRKSPIQQRPQAIWLGESLIQSIEELMSTLLIISIVSVTLILSRKRPEKPEECDGGMGPCNVTSSVRSYAYFLLLLTPITN